MWKIIVLFSSLIVIPFVYAINTNNLSPFDTFLNLSLPFILVLAFVIPISLRIKRWIKNRKTQHLSSTYTSISSGFKKPSRYKWEPYFTKDPKKYGNYRNPPTPYQLDTLQKLGYKGKTPKSSADADRLIKKGPRRR